MPLLVGCRPSLSGWRPSLAGWRPLLVGWRPLLSGWRPLLVGWRPLLSGRLDAIASRLDAIASRLKAIAIRLDAIASRLQAIANRLEAIAFGWRPLLCCYCYWVEAIVSRLEVNAIHTASRRRSPARKALVLPDRITGRCVLDIDHGTNQHQWGNPQVHAGATTHTFFIQFHSGSITNIINSFIVALSGRPQGQAHAMSMMHCHSAA